MEKILATVCPTCRKVDGDLEPKQGPANTKTHEIDLSSLNSSASICTICAFVQDLIAQDPTTPRTNDPVYNSSTVRVNVWGLRFTGQWQGSLVIEVFEPSVFVCSLQL